MPTAIERPRFYEGQLLGADDLQRSLDYARHQDARHARCSHTWGIAVGLEIKKVGDSFELSPGVAIDSSGAAIVVADPVKLGVEQLEVDVPLTTQNDNDQFFPVFISRTNEDVRGQQGLGRCNGNSQATRVTESYKIRYRRHATGWDQQPSVGFADGPPDSTESDRVVLLGFVQWKDHLIVGFKLEDTERPRFVGVRADEVQASGGRLMLRSRPPKTADAPMIVLDQGNDKKPFAFGVDNGQGEIKPVFSVDAKGNIEAEGTLKVPVDLNVGQVFIQSGMTTDGAKLPLPPGVSEQQAQDSNVTIHIHLTARMDLAGPPPAATSFAVPHKCVSDQFRRVTCVNRWITPGGAAAIELPGVCEYLMLVAVPAQARSAS